MKDYHATNDFNICYYIRVYRMFVVCVIFGIILSKGVNLERKAHA